MKNKMNKTCVNKESIDNESYNCKNKYKCKT